MALSDYMGGQGWSGHKAPDGSQTNPDNDPEIAASQERLRQYAELTRDQLTNPKVVGQKTVGSGDDQSMQDIIQYDSPFGPIVEINPGQFRTGEKFWWRPGLAEPMEIRFDDDGKIAAAKPKDSKYSFGEQLGDFAGNLATMGASMLAMYGAAYGLGSTVGTGVGTEGAAVAGETAAASAAPTASSSTTASSLTAAEQATMASMQGLEAAEGAALVNGGAGYGAAAAPVATSAATNTATNTATNAAADTAWGANSAADAAAYERMTAPAATWWDSVINGGKALLGNGQVMGGIIAGAGSGIASYLNNQAQVDNAQAERDWRSAEADKERKYKARNMNVQNMPRIQWTPKQPAQMSPQAVAPLRASEPLQTRKPIINGAR
jgi:hypothetical protein